MKKSFFTYKYKSDTKQASLTGTVEQKERKNTHTYILYISFSIFFSTKTIQLLTNMTDKNVMFLAVILSYVQQKNTHLEHTYNLMSNPELSFDSVKKVDSV